MVGRDTSANNQETKDDGLFKDNDNNMVKDDGTTSLDVVNSIDIILEFSDKTPTESINQTRTYCAYYPK